MSKVNKLDREDLLDDILTMVFYKLHLPNNIFDKKDFTNGEEDEGQERYL